MLFLLLMDLLIPDQLLRPSFGRVRDKRFRGNFSMLRDIRAAEVAHSKSALSVGHTGLESVLRRLSPHGLRQVFVESIRVGLIQASRRVR